MQIASRRFAGGKNKREIKASVSADGRGGERKPPERACSMTRPGDARGEGVSWKGPWGARGSFIIRGEERPARTHHRIIAHDRCAPNNNDEIAIYGDNEETMSGKDTEYPVSRVKKERKGQRERAEVEKLITAYKMHSPQALFLRMSLCRRKNDDGTFKKKKRTWRGRTEKVRRRK
ncbi:hypothetical protein PUN28_000749 [Cardiocondyla obscurior]|uniref:Uncharacterized protein n=1 Tax=Cardiocondyla obscurior TaxID=286306 RepID=A0AAW2H1A2_9HYME